MSFIRIKKIKNKEYAYLIKNRWLKTKKQPKQKVIGYLGRTIRPKIKSHMNETSFFDFKNIYEPEDYTETNPKEKILKDLIEFEIARHDIDIELDFNKPALKANNREVVLKVNEGFMCSYTIKILKNLSPNGEEEEVALELAKGFVNAGIAIPKEIFIGYFSKIFK